MSDTAGSLKPFLYDWRGHVASERGPESATTRHVLITLSLYMSIKGESCFPSIDTLVEDTGLTRPTVIKHLKKAQKEGWLTVSKHGYQGQKWARNEYRPTLPESVEKAVKEVNHPTEKVVKQVNPLDPEGGKADTERQLTSSRKAVKEVNSNSPKNKPSNNPGAVARTRGSNTDPVTGNNSVNEQDHDLSFLPERDRTNHLADIEHNLDQLDSENVHGRSEVPGRGLDRLKRLTIGGSSVLNMQQARHLTAFLDEHGWTKTVAACTIAANKEIPLCSLDAIAEQWSKASGPVDDDPYSGMLDLSAQVRQMDAKYAGGEAFGGGARA